MDLVYALENAASANNDQRKAGEKELEGLEKQPGFYVNLLGIYGSDSVSESSRYLSIIYLKNAVERKWRRPATFSNEEKHSLRTQLLSLIESPSAVSSTRLSKQLAVTIATIARTDFPRAWPQLLEELNSHVIASANSGSVSTLIPLLETMHQTLKKLGTARIGQARIHFNEFSISQIELYWQLFTTFKIYSALKIVGTLLYEGHDRSHRFEGPKRVFGSLLPMLQSNDGDEKIVRRIGKIYERLVSKHPLVFCGFREDAALVTQFYSDYLSSRPEIADDGRPGPVIQSMYITLDLTRLAKSKDRPDSSLPLNLRPRDAADNEDLQTSYFLVSSVLTAPRISSIVDALIQYYFQMTSSDLELWKDDPGEFVIEESRQNPEFSTVICAEMLFAQLLRAWPDVVAPRSQNLIEQAVQSGEELKVEAALRALEYGAATFSESFDITPIIHMLGTGSNSPLIRRRLCLVIGGWIPVKGPELQQLAFELVKSTLESKWDIVVQLGALELVRICCDDLDFQPQLFEIAAERVFSTAYGLLQTTSQSTEVKIQVLKVLGTVIEGLNVHLNTTDVDRILNILPDLWTMETEQSNHHLVQGAVLQMLSHLVTAVGVSTVSLEQCFKVSMPLVDVATDPSQPLSSYLMEDGLAVWKALLVNAPQATAPLLTPLFERLLHLLEEKTEYLGLTLSILESHLWLDYQLATLHYNKLFGLFSLYLNDGCALDEALLILLCAEVIMMMATKSIGSIANSGGRSLEAESMQQTGLQQWMQNCILRAANEEAEMDIMIQAGKCMNVLSLLSLQTSGAAILQPDAIFSPWLSKLRGVSDPRDRKLGCMGVSALLLAHPDLYLQNASLYIQVMSSIVEEIPDTAGFSQFYHNSANDEENKTTAEEQRQQAARSGEIAVTFGLQAFIKEVSQYNQQQGRPELYTMAVQMGLFFP